MLSITNRSLFRAGAFALTLIPFTFSSGQQPSAAPAAATTRYSVTVVRIKPDMLNEWLDLQRNEVIPAQKKAGVKERTILQTTVGNSFEYTILTPYPSFAAMDNPGANERALGAEAAARLAAKLRKCIDQQRSFLSTRQEDMNIPAPNATANRLIVRRVMPGKQQEALDFVRTEFFPAFKKAKADGKIAGFSVWTRGVGAQAGEMTINIAYNKFADMDAGFPPTLVLGQAAVTKLNAKLDTLSTAVQQNIRRRVADLSF